MRKLLLILCLIPFLPGCEDISALGGPSVKVTVAVEEPLYINSVRKVLERRFSNNLGSLFSSVESEMIGDKIRFTFSGGAPGRETLNYLVGTKGAFRLITEEGDTVIDANHVRDAEAKTANGQAFLLVALDSESGSELRAWTADHIGKPLIAKFDDKILSRAVITEPLAKYFQMTVNVPMDELERVASLIPTGSLESGATIVSYTTSE